MILVGIEPRDLGIAPRGDRGEERALVDQRGSPATGFPDLYHVMELGRAGRPEFRRKPRGVHAPNPYPPEAFMGGPFVHLTQAEEDPLLAEPLEKSALGRGHRRAVGAQGRLPPPQLPVDRAEALPVEGPPERIRGRIAPPHERRERGGQRQDDHLDVGVVDTAGQPADDRRLSGRDG